MSNGMMQRIVSLLERLSDANADDVRDRFEARREELERAAAFREWISSRLDQIEAKLGQPTTPKPATSTALQQLSAGQVPVKWVLWFARHILPLVASGGLVEALHRCHML